MVKVVDRHRRMAIVGFTHPLRPVLLAHLDDDQLAAGMHLVEFDAGASQVRTGGNALIAMAVLLPWPLRGFGKVVRQSRYLTRLVIALYDLVARNRGRLSRLVPDVDAVERLP